MTGVSKQRRGRIVLLHLAVLHHIDIVGELPDNRQIMGDEDHRHAKPLLQIANEIENLCLHGHVERRGRLISNQHVRVVGESHGNHDTLALPARELMRILIEPGFRLGICTCTSSSSASFCASRLLKR